MKRFFHPLLLSLAVIAAAEVVSGCNGENTTNPDAKIAEDALGVQPDAEGKKTAEATRKVLVEKDTKVTDQATGQVISEKKEVTPITIVEQKKEKTDVNVKVGETKATTTGAAKALPAAK